MNGYEIVQDEIYTSAAGVVAKAASAPAGKVVVGGGFRWIKDTGLASDDVFVVEVGPFGGAFGKGAAWYAKVKVDGPGTLRTFAVCVDA